MSLPLQLLATIEDLLTRVRRLESVRGARFTAQSDGLTQDTGPATVNPGSGTSRPVVPPPEGLSTTWGVTADGGEIYIDCWWSRPSSSGGAQVTEYEAEIAKVGFGVFSSQRTENTSCRFVPLEPNTTYQIRIRAISGDGRSSDYVSGITSTGKDNSPPAIPTGFSVGSGMKTVTATWNANTEADVADGSGEYEIQIDTANTFNTPSLRTKRVGGTVTSFDGASQTTYYLRVRAVDSSGNTSGWTTALSTTPGQAGSGDIAPQSIQAAHIQDAAIVRAKIGDLAVDTAKIADAAITNAKIGAVAIDDAKISSLSAAKLTAGTIAAAVLTIASSGVLRTGRTASPFHYLIMDANGLRLYRNGSSAFSGGTLTAELAVPTGNAYFAGTIDASTIQGSTITGGLIRTTTSGRRLEMGTNYAGLIQCFNDLGQGIALMGMNVNQLMVFQRGGWGVSITDTLVEVLCGSSGTLWLTGMVKIRDNSGWQLGEWSKNTSEGVSSLYLFATLGGAWQRRCFEIGPADSGGSGWRKVVVAN